MARDCSGKHRRLFGRLYSINSKAVWIPLGTLTANLSAGFLIGLALAWFSTHPSLSPAVRLFVITGFLGGLSTLSTFSAENLAYLMQGELLEALEHIGIHTCGTIFATWVGYSLLTNWL